MTAAHAISFTLARGTVSLAINLTTARLASLWRRGLGALGYLGLWRGSSPDSSVLQQVAGRRKDRLQTVSNVARWTETGGPVELKRPLHAPPRPPAFDRKPFPFETNHSLAWRWRAPRAADPGRRSAEPAIR